MYWSRAEEKQQGIYPAIAKFYRDQIISRAAANSLARHFENAPHRRYLHAGCGSGGSDWRIALDQARFHFLDVAPGALRLHGQQPMQIHGHHVGGDIFALPYSAESMDGIFNLGVMEHFHEPEIAKILAEFRRVLKPDGKLLLFWPPDFGLSVLVLSAFLKVVNRFRKEPLELYPEEVSRIRSFRWTRELLARSGFRASVLEFGPRDLFTYVLVVAGKTNGGISPS